MGKTFFGTDSPTEAQLGQLCTVKDVDDQMPPTFLWTVADDYMVNATDSLEYAGALLRHHVPVKLHMFDKAGHGMSKGTQNSASTLLEINHDAAQWLPLVDL